jgi:glutamate carboxypeptidase
MGADLKSADLSFLQTDLPVSELERLKRFSEIDSATLNVAGVDEMQTQVASILESLHFKIRLQKGESRFGSLIVAERPGRRATQFISLVMHADTVLPNEQAFSLKLSEDKAVGSGVIDDKGGIAVGLSALERFLKAFPETEYSLRVICSPNEEMGSVGFIEAFRQLGPDTVVGLGLEPGIDNGSIIHQRRGNRWYDIEILGKEAHAGRSYGEHANAAHDAARKIEELARLNNARKHISVNVGHIEAGKDKHNIICGWAKIKLDTRFPSLESRDSLHRKIERILSQPADPSTCGRLGTTTSFKIVDDCPPFSLTRSSRTIARRYAALISQLEGRKVYSQPAGGAGDVNYLSGTHNFVLDGLGPVGGGMHTAGEFVQISTLKTRAQALAGILHHLQTLNLDKRALPLRK